METSEGTPDKRTWFIIFGALVLSVGTYGLLCFFLSQSSTPRQISPSLDTMRPFLIGLGIIALVVSLTWLRLTVDGKIGGEGRPVQLTPMEFQTHTIVALAIAEACATVGLLHFFLGAPQSEFWGFAAGTLFVDLAFILPRGVQFWASQSNQN